MEPLISPWLIYLIGTINSLYGWAITLSIIFGIVSIIFLFISAVFSSTDDGPLTNTDEEDIAKSKKYLKFFRKYGFITIFFIILSIIVPERNVVIGMIVAQNITKENLKSLSSTAVDAKNSIKEDVIDIVDVIMKRVEEKEKKTEIVEKIGEK